MTTFTGFSEEDLRRIKIADSESNNETIQNKPTLQENAAMKKIERIGFKAKNSKPQYKLELKSQPSDEVIDNITFEKCRLSLPDTPDSKPTNNNDNENNNNVVENETTTNEINNAFDVHINNNHNQSPTVLDESKTVDTCTIISPDVLRVVTNYTEDELAAHKVKLEELQLKQRLMEEQNKKRKEMLAKALADRTKQTEEEVLKLEKIKKELQVLDGQFSMDVSVLRKKIDQACITYADAEKHYLKIEKDFLQAKINLQKEKEKKELLTEHLCALITHNETRKAQKLETLMYQLVDDKKDDVDNVRAITPDDEPVIVDGVDVKTGKIVDIANS